MEDDGVRWCLAVAVVALACMVLKLADFLWWRPKRVTEYFAKQGIRGPPYRFCFGCVREMVALAVEASAKPMIPQNSHNILPRVLSFYHHWKTTYGSIVLLWFGPRPRLTVADPELIREIFLSNTDAFERYESHPLVRQLEGEGLVALRGEKWAYHRKVLSPTFHAENLKLLLPFIGKTVLDMVEKLAGVASGEEVEIDVSEWFQTVTEDSITRIAFGQSYNDGKAVFRLQAQQMAFAAECFRKVFIPGYRFLPTKMNTDSWKLEKEMKRSLERLIELRKKRSDEDEKGKRQEGNAKDLLGLMIEASAGKQRASPQLSAWMTVRDIVEECKTFFFAGKQTTSNLLTWTAVVLAMHPDWQERARAEVLRVCGSRSDELVSREELTKLNTLGMILYETLRLYPPAVATIRRAKVDVDLGHYRVPRGTELMIPIMAVHHDARLWGPDVAQFNPARFADGAARAATHPAAFMPFGLGPRTCIGQNVALLEAKLTLAILLRRFAIRLSPSYVHAPTVLMLLYPQYGAPLLFRPLPPPPSDDPNPNLSS
ncbi:cytochrome P450 734A6-like [Zingiber officinale]|uniref:Cytochrome P450 734A1 n=1 Tax=Zingiber officinale TaxID=94328 RepID=A0A8J5IQH7_ZINOF|nr:cytochrome P450 734A6-like [Zingiber officinale]KAG6539029.1 hypothetical protein ZIOFF_004181 [Zingiber officinale]